MSIKTRLIPVLLLKNGRLVRSESFRIHQFIGNPINEVKRFNEWNVDELIYLDITRNGDYDLHRDDLNCGNQNNPRAILEEVSKTCFMPLTWGGNLKSIEDMRECFALGADKITINSEAVRSPELITEAAHTFGNQAVVVSIDVHSNSDGTSEVYIEGGTTPTGKTPVSWVEEAVRRGAGEILLQSIQRDGSGSGYDLEMIRMVANAVRVPVIACSGVGSFGDYSQGVNAGASAVAAANIWHFKELTDRHGKRALHKAGINVRYKPGKTRKRR